jgi:Domain of unknown function (DUF4214)
MDNKTADTITGLLYGNLLQRNADREGYSYYYEMLVSSKITLQQAIIEFLCSEEFYEHFIVNQTPNELARHLLISFFGPRAVKTEEPKKVALALIRRGVPSVVQDLISEVRFRDQHGEFGVPRYVERR